MTQAPLTLSHQPMFDDDAEAMAAFYRKELPWLPGDTAYVFILRHGNKVRGHDEVKIVGVAGISSDGLPIYTCETLTGNLRNVEADQVKTKQELLFNPDGTPSIYFEWLKVELEQKEHLRRRQLTEPITVTMKPTW